MVHDVSEHVFQGRAEPGDTAAMLERFSQQRTLRAVMQVALERYARRRLAPVAAPPASANLESLLDRYCMDCHDEGGTGPAFTPHALSPGTLAAMLDQVAFFGMPKSHLGMPSADRAALTRELVGALWEDEHERASAWRFFGDGRRAAP